MAEIQLNSTAAQLDDAVTKRHNHTNASTLGAITDAKVSEWNTVSGKIAPSNIKAGSNVSVAVSGNDVTISASGGSGGDSADMPDITVPPEGKFFFHPNSEIRNYMPNANVNLMVTVPSNAVWTTKEYFYTVDAYSAGQVYPLTSYIIDLYFSGMNAGETYNFEVTLLKGETVISKTNSQHIADSASVDRVSILSSDNPLSDSLPMNVGDKLTLRIRIMTNATQSKTLYMQSNVVGKFYSGMTQNPSYTSSEMSTHFTEDDKLTTTAKELRKQRAMIESLQAQVATLLKK